MNHLSLSVPAYTEQRLREVDSNGQEVEKDVDYSKVKVKSEFSPHKKEIESDGQHEKKDVKGEIEIAGAALIQQENSEGDAVEGVLGVGGDDSNSLKTVNRLSKSDEVGSDNVVRGFKDVKSLSSKRIQTKIANQDLYEFYNPRIAITPVIEINNLLFDLITSVLGDFYL
ncbi:hypothetical protein Tco_0995557 [Tanacetum coccineum]